MSQDGYFLYLLLELITWLLYSLKMVLRLQGQLVSLFRYKATSSLCDCPRKGRSNKLAKHFKVIDEEMQATD